VRGTIRRQFITRNRRLAFGLALAAVVIGVATVHVSVAWFSPAVMVLPLLAGGLLYAAVAGSFSRYSWPVTVAVVGPGTLAVAIGWQGPPRPRPVRAGVAARRAAWWAVPLVTGGLWELTALAGQPSLTTDSPAHPTISTLTDPLLASHLGRSLFLASWLILGGWLIER